MSKITREKSHRARLERGMDSFFLTKMFDGEIYSQIKDHCRLVVLRFTPRMRKARLFWKAVCRNVSMVGLRVKRKRRQGKQWLWGVAWLHEARTSECSGHGPKAADLASENSSNLPFSQRRLVCRRIHSRLHHPPPQQLFFTGWKEICVEIKLEKFAWSHTYSVWADLKCKY